MVTHLNVYYFMFQCKSIKRNINAISKYNYNQSSHASIKISVDQISSACNPQINNIVNLNGKHSNINTFNQFARNSRVLQHILFYHRFSGTSTHPISFFLFRIMPSISSNFLSNIFDTRIYSNSSWFWVSGSATEAMIK